MLSETRSPERAWRAMWPMAAAAVLLRLAFIFQYRIDSDEPQHLHVAWAWSRGLVQYRDVFDNHFPLLHLLFAPLMSIVPESSAVFPIMRLAIAPFAIASAWLVYLIGRRYVGDRRAAIAAVIFSVMPPWLPKSVEFRNDTLWMFFWLAAVALIVARPRPAYLLAGVAGGLCLLASVKALPLLLAHVLAFIFHRDGISWKSAMRIAAGVAIPTLGVAGALFALGAFDDMLYAAVLYNAAVPVDAARRVGGAVAFIVVAPALALRAPRAMRASNSPAPHLMLFMLWYSVVLLCFWPILSPRDFLPIVPLGAVLIATAVPWPIAAVLVTALASVLYERPWRSSDVSREPVVDAAVGLTRPGEYVFDLKGDTVFRLRPVRPIYDAVGRALINNGTFADRGPEDIAARGCCAAIQDASHIPPRTRAFLNAHFIDAGPLRVCGTAVRGGKFTIAVPQVYAVVARDPSRLTLDGVPYRGPRFLAAGPHTLAGDDGATVIWSRAVRGNA